MNLTKYVLNGGHSENAVDGGQSFYSKILNGLPNEVEVLSCFFARPENKWEGSLEKTNRLFSTLVPDKKVNLQIATYNDFIHQITDTQVLILHGGSTDNLLQALVHYPRLKESLVDKTVVGISAGVHVISEFFLKVSPNGDLQLEKGLGYLPIKATVHYRSDIYDSLVHDIFDWNRVDEFLADQEQRIKTVSLRDDRYPVN